MEWVEYGAEEIHNQVNFITGIQLKNNIMNIGRTLFWFKDGNDMLIKLNEDFFGLSILLNRLLNEKYDGKKIKYININFSTYKTYELHASIPKDDSYYYGGHLRYYGVFDKVLFEKLSKTEQNSYVWDRACKYLCKSGYSIKNKKLKEAAEYAYNRGIELNMNPDYKMIETDITFQNQYLNASVWVNFQNDGMYSKFVLEKEGEVVFEKNIDKAKNGIEFFLEMYKKIELDENYIVIKGSKAAEYLPLRIPLEKIIF